jgi:hypothetical protein
MNPSPQQIEVGDVACLRGTGEDSTFYCIPGAPKPELAPNGRPTLGLWMIPPQPMLQLGSRWTLDPADIAAIRAALTARTPTLKPESVQVVPAPVTVDEAVVLIDNGSGGFDELARSSTSNYPPYAAIFSQRLDDAQAARVASALNGARGRLLVEYRGRLGQSIATRDNTDSVTLVRRVDVSTWFDDGTGAESIHVLPSTPGSAP